MIFQMIFLIVRRWCSIPSTIVLSQRIDDDVWDCIICMRNTTVDEMEYHRRCVGDWQNVRHFLDCPKSFLFPSLGQKWFHVRIDPLAVYILLAYALHNTFWNPRTFYSRGLYSIVALLSIFQNPCYLPAQFLPTKHHRFHTPHVCEENLTPSLIRFLSTNDFPHRIVDDVQFDQQLCFCQRIDDDVSKIKRSLIKWNIIVDAPMTDKMFVTF
jgi:hypothetical protein